MPAVSSLSLTALPPAEVVFSSDSPSGLLLRMYMKGVGAAAVSADTSQFTLLIQDGEFKKAPHKVIITSGTLKTFFSELAGTTSSIYEQALEVSDLPYGSDGAIYAPSMREFFVDNTQGVILSLPTFTKSGKPSAPIVQLLDRGLLVPGTVAPNVGKVATTGVKVRVDLLGSTGGSDLKIVYASTTYQSGTGVYTTVDQTAVTLTDDDRSAGFLVFSYNVPNSIKDSSNSTVFYVENTAGMDSDPSERILCSNGLRVDFANDTPLVSASINSSSEITVKLAPNFYVEGDTSSKVSFLIRVAGGLATAPWFSTDSMNNAAPTGILLNQDSAYDIKKVSNAGGTAMVDIDANKVYELVAVMCAASDSLPAISANVPLYKLGVVSQSKNSNIVKGLKRASILAANASVMNTDNLVLTKLGPNEKVGAGSLVLSGLTYLPSTNPTGQAQMWDLSSTKDGVKKLITRSMSSFSTAASVTDLAAIKALTVPAADVAPSITYELSVTDVLPLSAAALLALPDLKGQDGVTYQSGTYWIKLDASKLLTFKDVIQASEVGKPSFISLNVVKSANYRTLLVNLEHPPMAEGLTLRQLIIDVADSEAFGSQDAVFISNIAAGPAVKSLTLPVNNGDAPEKVSLYTFATLGSTTPVDLSDGTKYNVKVGYVASQKGFSVTQASDESVQASLHPITSEDGVLTGVAALTATASAPNKSISGTFTVPAAVAGHTYLGCKVSLFASQIRAGSEIATISLGSTATSYAFSLYNLQENNYTVSVISQFRNIATLAGKEGSESYVFAKFPAKFKIFSSVILKAPYGTHDVLTGSAIDNKSALKINVTMYEESAPNVDIIIVTIPHSAGNSLTLARVGTTAVWSANFNAKEGIQYGTFMPVVVALATTVSGAGWDYAPRSA